MTPAHIEDYALIGDTHTAALISRDGSIDWLCLPRFDAGACFAALLGTEANGRWLLAPKTQPASSYRSYVGNSLVLKTVHNLDPDHVVEVIDFMATHGEFADVIRIVRGVQGQVEMRLELSLRFDYGSIVPWIRTMADGITAVGGPDGVLFHSEVDTVIDRHNVCADFSVAPGDERCFVMTWHPSHNESIPFVEPRQALRDTMEWWAEWSSQGRSEGRWAEAVDRSLITLKSLSYAPTGGIVAAATTSLPERLGGVRNWDYRFCWLRDATFTLSALMHSGFKDEARAWCSWLLRAIAGDPADMQIMYGAAGERRLTETELPWLDGYEGAKPVRIGNAAVRQQQLDVYGEVMSTFYEARVAGIPIEADGWVLERALLDHLTKVWRAPDNGIWEVRGPRRQFTHSKVMAWVAFDRGIRSAEEFQLAGPVEQWRKTRDEIFEQVCERGFSTSVGSFVQSYDSDALDASLLMIPLVDFLPATDPRMVATVAAIERDLLVEGLVLRYRSDEDVEELPPGEGSFLACTFWFADNLALQGRVQEATEIFERLVALSNDVGLLSEQYDHHSGRLVGNFPQAFSHVSLVNSAHRLAAAESRQHHATRAKVEPGPTTQGHPA